MIPPFVSKCGKISRQPSMTAVTLISIHSFEIGAFKVLAFRICMKSGVVHQASDAASLFCDPSEAVADLLFVGGVALAQEETRWILAAKGGSPVRERPATIEAAPVEFDRERGANSTTGARDDYGSVGHDQRSLN